MKTGRGEILRMYRMEEIVLVMGLSMASHSF